MTMTVGGQLFSHRVAICFASVSFFLLLKISVSHLVGIGAMVEQPGGQRTGSALLF